jgi:tetratricopeptide (TPR) repeat protein
MNLKQVTRLAAGLVCSPRLRRLFQFGAGEERALREREPFPGAGQAAGSHRRVPQRAQGRPPSSARPRLKLADAYAQVGNANQAFREYVRAADLLPQNNDAQVKAAGYLVAAGQFEDARTRIQPVIDRDPTNVDAQLVLGNALVGLKDLDGAVKEIEEAIKLEPERGLTYSNLAAIKMQQGNQAEAKAAFQKAVEVDPKSIQARLALAYFLWSTSDIVGAEASLKAAVAADPTNVLANRTIAAFYMGSNRAAQAEPFLKTLAQGGSPEPTLLLADYYLSQRRNADATAVLQPLLANPSSIGAAETRLAAIAYASNDKTKAHGMLDTVIKREPGNSQALLLKAQWLIGEKRPQEALDPAQAAVKADPKNVSAHFYLGASRTTRSSSERRRSSTSPKSFASIREPPRHSWPCHV